MVPGRNRYLQLVTLKKWSVGLASSQEDPKQKNALPEKKKELPKDELLVKDIDIRGQANILNEGDDVVLFLVFLLS